MSEREKAEARAESERQRKERDRPSWGKDFRPAFVHTGRAWYSDTALPGGRGHYVDEVMIGNYCKTAEGHDDGCGDPGEFMIRWYGLSTGPAAHLEVFDESWHWFATEPGKALLAWLIEQGGDKTPSPTPEEVCAKLTELGFHDDTKEKPE